MKRNTLANERTKIKTLLKLTLVTMTMMGRPKFLLKISGSSGSKYSSLAVVSLAAASLVPLASVSCFSSGSR